LETNGKNDNIRKHNRFILGLNGTVVVGIQLTWIFRDLIEIWSIDVVVFFFHREHITLTTSKTSDFFARVTERRRIRISLLSDENTNISKSSVCRENPFT